MKKDNVCKLFLCYRNAGKSSDVAVAFKNYVDSISARILTDSKIKIECFFSGAEAIGNYEQDIPNLVGESDFFIIFADSKITESFVNYDGTVNKECITAKEFCETEKLRQKNEIQLLLLNIDGYSFSKTDSRNIRAIFAESGVIVESSVNAWVKLNENPYSSSLQQEAFDRLINGILQSITKTTDSQQKKVNKTESHAKLLENFNKYFQQQYSENIYTKLDDIGVGDGDNDNQLEIEKTFIDLDADEVYGDNFARRPEPWFNNRSFDRKRRLFNFPQESGFTQKVIRLQNTLKPYTVNSVQDMVSETNGELGWGDGTEKRERNLILMGRAGQGKTTLMQYIALLNWAQWLANDIVEYNILRLAKKERLVDKSGISPRITIKITLSIYDKFTSLIRSDGENDEFLSFEYYILYLLYCAEKSVKPYGTKSTDDEKYSLKFWLHAIKEENNQVEALRELLKKEKVLVLFDGLDEVKSNRQSVVSEIRKFVSSFSCYAGSNVLTVTTTRKEKSEELLDEEQFTVYDLRNLNRDKVEKCVDKYIRAKWRSNPEEKINDIMKYYDQSEYTKLMQTPLEVTMICMVYNAYNSMPKSIETLYKRYVAMYIQRERKKQYPEGHIKKESREFFAKPYTEDLINDFLNAIAYELEYNLSGITREKAVEIARRVNIDEEGELRNEIDDENYFEILVETVFTRLSFFDCNNAVYPAIYSLDNHHASVREFLAARYFVVNRSDEEVLRSVQAVLTEQEGSPQHWGIFRFLLGLLINKADLVKKILRGISKNCTQIFECDDIISVLTSCCFGAKVAVKLICEEQIFDGHVNYRKILLNAALNTLDLEETPNAQSNYRLKLLHYAQSNNLLEELYSALETRLVNKNITDSLREMIALISISESSKMIDRTRYNELYNALNSNEILNFIFKRCFNPDDYIGTVKNSVFVDGEEGNRILGNVLQNAFNSNKAINISFSDEYPLICNDKKFFCLVEFIRALFLNRNIFERFYSDELGKEFFKSDYRDQDIESIFSEKIDSILFCSHKFEKEEALRCYFSIYKAENDDGIMDKLLSLLKKYNLNGIFNLFSCIKNMNVDNFISYVKSVHSGVWDSELIAIFGNHPRFVNLQTRSNFCVHPATIMLHRHLSGNDSTEFLEENTKTMFELINGKTLNAQQAFLMFEKGMYFTVLLFNVTNASHIKLIDEANSAYVSQLPFIFHSLEWKSRFDNARFRSSKVGVYGAYIDALNSEDYQERKGIIKAQLGLGEYNHYFVVSILNFLLADDKCGNKELNEYASFTIGKYAKAIEKALVYTYSPHNVNLMSGYQYMPSKTVTDNLFHGCANYKTLLNNLIFLAKDSKCFLEYFKRVFLMILNSEEYVRTAEIRGLCHIYNGDDFLMLINSLRAWSNASDDNERLNRAQIVASYFTAVGKTGLFSSSQVIYTMLLRFIFNNFKPDSFTGQLIGIILEDIPSDGNYSSVRREAQNYIAMLPKNIEKLKEVKIKSEV